ncbi:MAG TPA: hypothetical protein PKD09_12070 [Aggregatilinea sp.]|uniref:hypothetical protein n=1 Tax=Aggregatilinea sp. TaxID=2806333 RepID=UPI002CE79AA5|nr:hypothetical protein [Aggregatilinea sp.]HML22379.1 hypothetical protein [Aggregatilinea sp.]
MVTFENGDLRLRLEEEAQGASFFSDVRVDGEWRLAGTGSRPVERLVPTTITAQGLAGEGDGLRWETVISPAAGGFRLETTLHADRPVALDPSMILWLGALDALDDRQEHTWRATILRAPTVNQQGLPGNDLMAAYFYDHWTRLETICLFPADALLWSPHRLLDFTAREVLRYRPAGRYGLGLVPAAPDVTFDFAPGDHRFEWWFTQRHREDIPSPWEAQTALVDAVAPLLDPVPALTPGALPWREMAARTLDDLHDPACWVTVEGQTGLRAYVLGSSAVGRDDRPNFELMTQLDVLWPLLLWQREFPDPRHQELIDRLLATLPAYHRPDWCYVANNFPPHSGDSFMDTWYFLENGLIKLGWVAYLTGDETLRAMFFDALHGATALARQTHYLFPLFADATDWQPRGSVLNVSVGGLYAAGYVLAVQMTGSRAYLDEAAAALCVMHALPPHQLTHEVQQLTFAAASAAFLAREGYENRPAYWAAMAADFTRLALRMGYWQRDPAVPLYDPRGMFQACASLSYPAYKENVEALLAWPELLRGRAGPAGVMAAFANLQRCHNTVFFDPYLPESVRRGPCPGIPYEDVATSEFAHTAELGKELYGAGEVLWSGLLFDALGTVDAPDVLCLCLDVPCLDLRPIPPAEARRYLLYNPAREARTVTLRNAAGERPVDLPPRTPLVASISGEEGA